ncbi:MAG: helix-turn-helix transcriptional regulator [Pseudomonadota bacterium]
MGVEFGSALKSWRTQRRKSQLDLGLGANVSARHISFLETGRSRPSRSMVLQLCDELDVPRGARNQLLTAAGHAPVYRTRGLEDADMTPIRDAVLRTMERHDPYPAIAMDRHWVAQRMNRTATLLLGGLDVSAGDSLLDAVLTQETLRDAIENLNEVLIHTIARLRTEIAHHGGDDVLEGAMERLAGLIDGPAVHDGPMPAFIPTIYRAGGLRLSLLSTFTQFGTAEDIALSELRIEMMFPADDETKAILENLAGAGST